MRSGTAIASELLVDTDVLVDHLRGTRRMDSALTGVAVSVVTRAELFAGRDDPDRLRDLLGAMFEIPVDRDIAELAGATRRAAGITLGDALIAATALVHDVPLLTRNRRHFGRVAALRLASDS